MPCIIKILITEWDMLMEDIELKYYTKNIIDTVKALWSYKKY